MSYKCQAEPKFRPMELKDDGSFETGISGKEYKYWIHSIGTSFEPVAGNYIFTKETKQHEWTPIYVGETGNLQRRLTHNHEKVSCMKRYCGTHIHTHTNSDNEANRRNEEADIRDKWNPPCNLED